MLRQLIRALVVASVLAGIGAARWTFADNPTQAATTGEANLADRVAALIEQLGDENYHARVNARWELERIGLAAFGQLREAVNHPNIQIANAARYLVQSQNVIWWLETDSVDVRRLLMDYNSLDAVERDTRLQELSVLNTDDALVALCRLARFESDEQLSKSAALYLMESLVDNVDTMSPLFPRSILLTIEDANRPGANWLRTLAGDLTNGETAVDAWRAFAAEEAGRAVSAEDTNVLSFGPGRIPSERARALRFYKWTGDWLMLRTDRAQTLAIVKESMALVADDAHACLEFSRWAVDAKLPELVIELAREKESHFVSKPSLGYLLAESQLLVGNVDKAEELAQRAREQIAIEAEKVLRIPSANLNDSVARRRIAVAISDLASRGLFDWAEEELKLAVEMDTSRIIDADARNNLAEFYWSSGKNREAALVLEPLLEDEVEQDLPGRGSNQQELQGFYKFYLGLAAIEEGKETLAGELLLESAELYPNPDVIIAMKQIANEEPLKSKFQEQFDNMVNDFRVAVATNEHTLAESPDRMTRTTVAYNLAADCNQLAWLLSKCDTSPEEAINLSLRSLEFSPGQPAFLDTLGRCYFAAGQVEKAIETQQRAVSSAPSDQLMRKQLKEFQDALQKQHKESVEKS